ncbi:MAG TPA: hypothetical protein VG815_05175 [Chloroflexota bacterium]|nr:hypothetical protein [Chloroflexota bacterium]
MIGLIRAVTLNGLDQVAAKVQRAETGHAARRYSLKVRSKPVAIVVIAAIYVAAAKLGFTMAVTAEQVTLVWPATGLSLAAFSPSSLDIYLVITKVFQMRLRRRSWRSGKSCMRWSRVSRAIRDSRSRTLRWSIPERHERAAATSWRSEI